MNECNVVIACVLVIVDCVHVLLEDSRIQSAVSGSVLAAVVMLE